MRKLLDDYVLTNGFSGWLLAVPAFVRLLLALKSIHKRIQENGQITRPAHPNVVHSRRNIDTRPVLQHTSYCKRAIQHAKVAVTSNWRGAEATEEIRPSWIQMDRADVPTISHLTCAKSVLYGAFLEI